MKIITHTILNPDFEYHLQITSKNIPDFNKPEHLMEYAARSCYDSLDKFQQSTAFMKQIVAQEHMDILEHGYLAAEFQIDKKFGYDWGQKYYFAYMMRCRFPYMKVVVNEDTVILAGNLRVWHEMQQVQYADLDGFFKPFDVTYLKYYLHFLAPSVFNECEDYPEQTKKNMLALIRADYEIVVNRTYGRNFNSRFPGDIISAFGSKIRLLAYAPPVEGYGYYTFQMENVSRALLAQHTRHRRFVHSVKSSRYVDGRNAMYVHNINEKPEEREIIDACFAIELYTYEKLRDSGMKKEDARGILPTNMDTNIITSGDIGAWEWYFHERCAKDAQEEIRNNACIIEWMMNETKA